MAGTRVPVQQHGRLLEVTIPSIADYEVLALTH
jgi:hypothetical protein